MQNERLNQNEIVSLYFKEGSKILYPDHSLSQELEALGLNPNDYIYDVEKQQIRNIDSLYVELLINESLALKQQIHFLKQNLYGSDSYDYMIAPKEQEIFGNPKNRDVIHYVKKIRSTSEGFDNTKENILKLARNFSQGDCIQPVRTEELMWEYRKNNKKVSPDEEIIKKLNNSDISIEEWERAIILKDFLYLQHTNDKDFPKSKNIYITDVMNKKYVYGKAIVYNKNAQSYCIDGEWVKEIDL